MNNGNIQKPKLVEKRYLLPFILVTSLFALWGFANDITNPMVAAFQTLMELPASEAALVQFAFYGGYATMAVPAALFIRRYSYKKGILLGLGLYAVGAFLFIPAALKQEFSFFCISLYILTFGLAFLETTANPLILSLGAKETSTRRLNLAQAFNPIGSLLGMYVAMNFIQAKLNPLSTSERALLGDAEFEAVKAADLDILTTPYLAIGIVIAIIFVLIFLVRMPKNGDKETSINLVPTFKRLAGISNYREGIIAQFFYVGVQTMCWTFIIQYGTHIFMLDGMEERAAEVLSQKYNIVAMVIFCCSRFICTFLLRFIKPGLLLTILASVGCALTLGVIFFENVYGLYCLVAISACMSLMFPTIYGIALRGLGEDAKFGAAGLIMAILGGSVLPPLQAAIIDKGTILDVPATHFSFILPLICFVVITIYGYRTNRRFAKAK